MTGGTGTVCDGVARKLHGRHMSFFARFNAEGTNSKNNTTGGHVRRTMSIARNENLSSRTVLDSGPRVRLEVMSHNRFRAIHAPPGPKQKILETCPPLGQPPLNAPPGPKKKSPQHASQMRDQSLRSQDTCEHASLWEH